MNQINSFREPGHRFTSSLPIDREIHVIYSDLERELLYADSQWQHDKVSELCLAAAADNIIALKKILICGISVNASDYDKRNALMVAASKGSINAVKLLLEKGCDFGLVDNFGSTALWDACRNSHDSCCSLLYDYGARLSDSIDEFSAGSMMCTAISKADHAGLMRLLQCGLNPNCGDYDQRTALHVASAAGDLRSVKILLEKGADPNTLDKFGRTPLLEAVRAGHVVAAKMLFDRGAKLGFLETERDSVQVERDVLNLSKSDGAWKARILNSSELVNSVSRLETDYLRLLLQFGANPNKAFDYDLRSPAHLAVCMNSVEICTLLLEYKADFSSDACRDRWELTPLDECKRMGNKFLSEVIQNIIKLTYSNETVDI
jgi:ankyrin repeat protein